MNTTLVPSLQHLSCCRTVASLFNHFEIAKRNGTEETIRQVQDAISRLTSSTPLQENLKQFIKPLHRAFTHCFRKFGDFGHAHCNFFDYLAEAIPLCWLSDGTIDLEKVARVLVKNENFRALSRFLLASTFCIFDDALVIWNTLYKIEQAHLGHNSAEIAKLWAAWLETDSAKTWESFLEWSLATPLWLSNVYMLKHAFQIISPAERSRYLLRAVSGHRVANSLVRFCLQVMTKEDQVQFFKESPVKVIRCMLSWPLRRIFFDLMDDLWPYLTAESFCTVLKMILLKIRYQRAPNPELLNIVKKLWPLCPSDFQEKVKVDPCLFNPLQFVLDFDESQEFPNSEFSKTFYSELPHGAVSLLPERQREARRRYRILPRRNYVPYIQL